MPRDNQIIFWDDLRAAPRSLREIGMGGLKIEMGVILKYNKNGVKMVKPTGAINAKVVVTEP